MVHGNNITTFYGIALNKENYDKIKKMVSLEHKDLFYKVTNCGNVGYFISGKIKQLINDKTDYSRDYSREDEPKIFALYKNDVEELIKQCTIDKHRIDRNKFCFKLQLIDFESINKDSGNYVENFLVRSTNNPSFIKIGSINDLSEYCSISELSIEMKNSYNEIKELLELIKDHTDIVPNLFLYKSFY